MFPVAFIGPNRIKKKKKVKNMSHIIDLQVEYFTVELIKKFRWEAADSAV